MASLRLKKVQLTHSTTGNRHHKFALCAPIFGMPEVVASTNIDDVAMFHPTMFRHACMRAGRVTNV
jgi:hypothetical protein